MSDPGKKYLLIDVPSHQTSTGGNVGSSFLRIGSPDPSPPMKELLEEIVAEGFIDDDRVRGPNDTAAHATVEGAGGTAGPGHSLSVAERKAETERFLTKGGWHEHTDGNRISTVVGDRIDVVRGNYKMVVLGRQDALENAAGWDVSGGHIEDGGLTPGGIHHIKWVQTWDGTWKVTELCEKGDVHSITHGNSKEENYGDTLESITGSENPDENVTQGVLRPTTKKKNPTITERTWATAIYSYTGSSNKPVPTMTDETHVTSTTETLHAGTITSNTYASTSITENTGKVGTPVPAISSSTHVGALSETLHAGALSTVSTIGVTSNVTTVGAISDVEISGAKSSIILGAVMADLEVSILRLEVKAGIGFLEIEAGLRYIEVCLGNKWSFNLGTEYKLKKDEWETAAKTLSVVGKEDTIGIKLKKLALQLKHTAPSVGIGLEPD
jgi:hypothetical protein